MKSKTHSQRTSKRGKGATNLLIDGSAITYAALYTKGFLSNLGKQTGVIYGFLQNMLIMSEKFNTTRLIICWDSKDTLRHKDFPEYKIKRKSKVKEMTEDEILQMNSFYRQQLELREQVLPAIGFKNNFFDENHEADDLLAHIALKLDGWGRVIMVTNDNDMFQCLDYVDLWFPREKKYFTKRHLKEKYGLEPSQWATAKAITGCDGDSVPGIQGVSDAKNKTSLVHRYLKGQMKDGVVKKRIECKSGKRIIKRNMPLVCVPYKNGEHIKRLIIRRNKFNEGEMEKIFHRYNFTSFLGPNYYFRWKEFIKRDKKDGY